MKELVRAEHVVRTSDGRYYLTLDGQKIARGVLKLYPELKNATKVEQNSQEIITEKIEVPMIPLPPNVAEITLLTRSKRK